MKLRRTIVVVVLLLLIGLLAILIRSRHQPTVSTLSLIKKDTASLQSPPSMGGNQVKTNSTYVSGSETTPELSSLSGGGIATAELDSQLNSARSNQVPRDWRVISNGPISNRQLY